MIYTILDLNLPTNRIPSLSRYLYSKYFVLHLRSEKLLLTDEFKVMFGCHQLTASNNESADWLDSAANLCLPITADCIPVERFIYILQLQWLRETTSYPLHLQVSQPRESHSLSDAGIVSLTSLSCTLYLLPSLVNWFGRRALPFLSWPRPWDNARFSILAAIKMPERFVVRRFLMG